MPYRQTGRRKNRTHMLGGCDNCRKRHVKCDQGRPECRLCINANLKCQGYGTKVQWMAENGNIEPQEKTVTRAHLYTEQARSLMSSNMTRHFQSRSIDRTLVEIDTWTRDNDEEAPQNDCLVLGPFGVLDINSQVLQPNTLVNTNLPAADSTVVGDVNLNDISSSVVLKDGALAIATPSISDSLTGIPDHLDWADLFNLDVETWFSPQMMDMNVDDILGQEGADRALVDTAVAPVQSNSPIWSPLTEVMDEVLDKEAPFLMHHFDTEVIGAIAALPFNLKSPYKILNVAAAVQTYADLTYLHKPVKCANLANLYGLMACSAQHLATNPSGTGISRSIYWQNLASNASQKAKEQMQKSLRDELEGTKRAKYKDQVMALMNLLAYAIATGYQNDIRCYMIDIERLLRLRGLPKRHISRRARLLHHMYTWNRIVGESTYVLHVDGPGPTNFTKPIPRPQTNNVACLDDFLRIEPGNEHEFGAGDSDTETDIALRDLHLQDTRQNPNTLYLQIYGLPETWLSLLSQTTRLANTKATLQKDTGHDIALHKRITRLEDMICAFASNLGNDRTKIEGPPSQHMLQALSSALVIFFYRRIMDVNALILQSHVDDVISSLRLFDHALTDHHLQGPGTAWPAFIAGCEAAPGERRESLLSWVETAYWKTGSQSFRSAKNMMQEVWQRRDQNLSLARRRSTDSRSSNLPATWVNICREKNTWIVLC